MSKIYSDTHKTKLFLENTKIKRAYWESIKVYSSGNIATYHIDNIVYMEEVEEGISCLNPTSFDMPVKTDYEFLGWALNEGGLAVSECIMGDDPIDLYAVWKVVDKIITLTTTYVSESEGYGESATAITEIDTSMYKAIKLHVNSASVYQQHGGAITYASIYGGNNSIDIISCGSGDDGEEGSDSTSNRDVTLNFKQETGLTNITISIRMTDGYYGVSGRGGGHINLSSSATLIAR